MNLSGQFKQFIKDHENDDPHALSLQSKRFSGIDLPLAVRQIQGRRIAKHKLPEWYANDDIIYPMHLPLEQCSSQYTALYKANLCKGNRLVDITGGLGIDFYYMSASFEKTVYVERDSTLSALAASNFRALGLQHFEVHNEDGVRFLQSSPVADWLYIDPARRTTSGRKVFLLEDCSPNLIEIEPLIEQKSRSAMIKLSPMIDISHVLKSMRNISDVHIVSHHNECKELIFIKDNTVPIGQTLLHCVNIDGDGTSVFTFGREKEDTICVNYAISVNKYLYEPNASVLKAGAYKSIAEASGLEKLHTNSHLYTSDALCPGFHGRKFAVEQIYGFSKNDIREVARLGHANISTRNFPMPADELKKRLRLKDGGLHYIFATTLADNKKVLIVCLKA